MTTNKPHNPDDALSIEYTYDLAKKLGPENSLIEGITIAAIGAAFIISTTGVDKDQFIKATIDYFIDLVNHCIENGKSPENNTVH